MIVASSPCQISCSTPLLAQRRLLLLQLCKAIPAGKVTTYGDMAKALGSSPRAIGQAMRRNPFAPVVPCHRVIATNMQLGGFSGQWVRQLPALRW